MTLYPSPLGPIAITAHEGRLVSIWFDPTEAPQTLPEDRSVVDRARSQLDEYFAGRRAVFGGEDSWSIPEINPQNCRRLSPSGQQ